MIEVHLKVCLPRNRSLPGWLYVEVDGRMVATFRALGRGSRGSGDTSLLNKGNLPTGSFDGNEVVETENWPQRSYGPWGAIRLKALSGNAILAEKQGRHGLLIHGGDLRQNGALRPTFGCLRLRNWDMKALLEIIETVRYHGESCWMSNVTVSVHEH